MTGGSSGESRRDAVTAIQQRLRTHPGYVEHMRIRAFATTLAEVFEPNYLELAGLLDSVAVDSDAAIEMLNGMSSNILGSGVISRINRHLHNYVAAASTLVDHARRLTKGRDGSIADEYARRRDALLSSPEIPFINGLRNLSLHHSLPVLAYTLRVTPAGVESSEAELSVSDLLDSDRWNVQMRDFISSHGKRMAIRPVVRRHRDLVFALSSWLIEELQIANRSALEEANELVVAVNAAMMGVDLDTARRRTAEESMRRTTIQ